MKINGVFVDDIVAEQLERIKKDVEDNDKDWVGVYDGEEGSGKSVLAMQHAIVLDPKFNINNVCFTADQFMERLKTAPKGSCIMLDEAYSAANARAALTEVNRAMIGVATEMRQRNLFVLFVLPTFFDLDKYFALWRCRTLFHCFYHKKTGNRGQYIIFPKTAKKMLFLLGKKFYNYSKPKSPYPTCKFLKYYVVDETEYRRKKAEAFKRRVVSGIAKKWKGQRDSLINELYHNKEVLSAGFEKIFLKWGSKPLSQREIQRIVQNYGEEEVREDS